MQYTGFSSLIGALATFFALSTTACAQPPTPPQPRVLAGITLDPSKPLQAKETQRKDADGKPLPVYDITFQGAGDALVPGVVTVPREGSGKRPAVLLLHGLGGDRNQLALLASLLTGKGYVTLSIDIAGHGARPRVQGKPVSELDLPEMHQVAAQTVLDLPRAVDYLAGRSDVDPKRIGFLGVSLGGVLGARFLGDEPRIVCAVLWAAGGDWGKLIATSQHPFAQRFREKGVSDPEQIEKVMADVDPVGAIGRAAGHPLLFINGDKDDIVPPACTDSLIAAAKQPKERVTLPGGHVPNLLEMATRSLAFLEKNLAQKGAAAQNRTGGAAQ